MLRFGEVAMTVLRRTWLATTLFVLVSTFAWWKFFGWSTAHSQLLQTVLLTPLVWWVVVGRQPRPRLWRGIVGGALVGFVTQAVQHIPKIWNIYLRRGAGNGDEQAVAIVSVLVYLEIAFWATTLGALVGLIAVIVQRRANGGVATPGPGTREH